MGNSRDAAALIAAALTASQVAITAPTVSPLWSGNASLTHTDARFALDVVEVARQYVVQHIDEHCDPDRLRSCTMWRRGSPTTIRTLPSYRGAPVMDCVVILEADDTGVTLDTWRRVDDMGVAVVVGIFGDEGWEDEHGTMRTHVAALSFNPTSGSDTNRSYVGISSYRRLKAWKATQLGVFHINSVISKARPFHVPVKGASDVDVDEGEMDAYPSVTVASCRSRLSHTLFLQEWWELLSEGDD